MSPKTFKLCLLFALISLQASWSQESPEVSQDEGERASNDEKLQSVQEFLEVLEEAYSCNLIVSSTNRLINSLTVSIVGRGAACEDAIDTLLQEFQPPEIVIEASIADPKAENDEVDAYDCLEGFGCNPDFQNQDTLIDPGTAADPH